MLMEETLDQDVVAGRDVVVDCSDRLLLIVLKES